jgi:hypothetical protein
MLLNFILLIIILSAIFLLYKQIKKSSFDYILPECKFSITNPKFIIDENIRIAKFSVYTKNNDRYFRDFPIGFKFYSNEKFKSKIKITYNVSGDDDIEIIYDKIVDFEDNIKEHIYYINDVIVGHIDIEIYTNSIFGKPIIKFEILQSNLCHMTKEYKLEIKFPK